MIKNFPRPNASVFVEITAPTSVRGTHVKVGDIVEVTGEDAGNIVAAGRGKVVPAPAPVPELSEEEKAAAAETKRLAAEAKKAAAEAKKQAAANEKAAAAKAKSTTTEPAK